MTSNKWLWRSVLVPMTLVLTATLALIVALALGWNSPRPTRPPDWQAANLPLRLEAASGETTVSLLEHPIADFTLEVEAVPLSSPDSDFNEYGLVYRAQDIANYYAFTVGSDGYYAVLRMVADEETVLVDWQQFPHVRRGQQANRLRVACDGAICRFYINDEYATTVEDSTWPAGDVGLWVRGFKDENTAVQFIKTRVWNEFVMILVASYCGRVTILPGGNLVSQSVVLDHHRHHRHWRCTDSGAGCVLLADRRIGRGCFDVDRSFSSYGLCGWARRTAAGAPPTKNPPLGAHSRHL
jgi:hypothetical protein